MACCGFEPRFLDLDSFLHKTPLEWHSSNAMGAFLICKISRLRGGDTWPERRIRG